MQTKRYRPKIDILFWMITAVANVILLAMLIVGFVFDRVVLFVTVPTLLFVNYFIVSPLFGYVELGDDAMFIKFGLLLKRRVPYSQIRTLTIDRRWYSESMLSIKNSIEHVNVRYNRFDVVTVSVRDNEAFVEAVKERMGSGAQ